VLEGDKHEVTSLAVSSDHSTIAIGYSNGLIRIWNVTNDDCSINTTLRYCVCYNSAAIHKITTVMWSLMWDKTVWASHGKRTGYCIAVGRIKFKVTMKYISKVK